MLRYQSVLATQNRSYFPQEQQPHTFYQTHALSYCDSIQMKHIMSQYLTIIEV